MTKREVQCSAPLVCPSCSECKGNCSWQGDFLQSFQGCPFPLVCTNCRGNRRRNKFQSIFSPGIWCCALTAHLSPSATQVTRQLEPPSLAEFLNPNSERRGGGKLNENKYFLAPLNQSLLQSKQPFVCSQCPGASFVKNYTCARSHRESLFNREDPSGVKGSWGMLLMLYLCPRVSWSLCGLFVRCPTQSGLILQLLLPSSW